MSARGRCDESQRRSRRDLWIACVEYVQAGGTPRPSTALAPATHVAAWRSVRVLRKRVVQDGRHACFARRSPQDHDPGKAQPGVNRLAQRSTADAFPVAGRCSAQQQPVAVGPRSSTTTSPLEASRQWQSAALLRLTTRIRRGSPALPCKRRRTCSNEFTHLLHLGRGLLVPRRMVRRIGDSEVTRADPQVVFPHLPALGVGAG